MATVLTIDDSKAIRDMISLTLGGAGYRVIEACNGAEGLQQLKSEPVSLVIVDLNMPVMNGLDALVFTAGIGENSSVLRALVCEGMEYLGIHMDELKNQNKTEGVWEINTNDSPIKILVIPTNEELMIAQDTYAIAAK